MNKIFVLFPIDLYNDLDLLKNAKIFLVEEEIYFNRASKKYGSMKFNILKPIYHRATMRSYYDYIKSKGINCTYIGLNDDWIKIVKRHIKNKTELNFYDPVDKILERKIKNNFEEYNILDSPRFLLSSDDLNEYDSNNNKNRQTSFYGWVRKRMVILMDKKDPNKPIGGRMTYDTYNRKQPYDGIENDLDDRGEYTDNKYVIEAEKYIKKTINDESLRAYHEIKLKFPIDRNGAMVRLRYFIRENLKRFGDYQDVIINDEQNSFVFHSGISPMMNIGLITPLEIVERISEEFARMSLTDKRKYINDIEGFIRQIVGWREFTRYMYEKNENEYINKNYFNCHNKLNNKWYIGSNELPDPVDMCIKKAFKFGYLHHIERLMIMSNYMVLSEINPKDMHKWFMEFSLDSYDWVMSFNVYCMASYSDGGNYTSKPYISTSKYVLKMSNFQKNKWTDEWDKKFWGFLKKNRNKFKKIGRMSALLKYIP